MSDTNLEGVVVFSENIQELNGVLEELNSALAQQSELVALNRESSEKMTEMMALISSSSTAMMDELKVSTSAMVSANEKLAKSISEEVVSKAMGQTNQLAVNLASLESSISGSIADVEAKLVNNSEIGALSAQQKDRRPGRYAGWSECKNPSAFASAAGSHFFSIKLCSLLIIG